jgi:MFS transporter, OFA family, oxalate/formate antiporter
VTEDDSGVAGGYYRWFVVAALFIVWAVVFGIQYSFGIFFKNLQEALGCSRGTVSLAMTVHLLVFALTMVPAGWVISRFDIRTVYSLATLGLGLPLALCSRISEPWQLYALYGLMGVSISIYGPSVFIVITNWFTAKRGLALGLASAGSGFGTLIAAPLSNALIDSYGWRNAFVILGLGSFLILLAISQFIRNPPGWPSAQNGSANGSPAGGSRVGRPESPGRMTFRQAITTRNILLIIAGSAAAQIASRVIVVHIAPHAMDVGRSPFAAAMALSIIGCGSVLGRILMGFIQDRIGARHSMIFCLGIMGLCLAALPFVTSDAAFFLFAILFGFAFGGDVPQVPALTVHCFGVASLSVIYAFISATVNIGSALGPSAAGYIFDLTQSYTPTFLGLSILLFLGAFSISRVK